MNSVNSEISHFDNTKLINACLEKSLELIEIYKQLFVVIDQHAPQLSFLEYQAINVKSMRDFKNYLPAPPSFQSWDKLEKAETRQEGWDLLVASVHEHAHQRYVATWQLDPLSPFTSIKERMGMMHAYSVNDPEKWKNLQQYVTIDVLYETAYTAEQHMMETKRHAANYTMDDYLRLEEDFKMCQMYTLELLATMGSDHKVRWETAVRNGQLFSKPWTAPTSGV